jgi:ABC-type sugar transport system permease subunit
MGSPARSQRVRGHATRSALPRWRGINWLPYFFLAPSAFLLIGVIGYPLITGFLYSFRNGSLLQLGEYVGLQNYADLPQMEDFRHALLFSALFAICSVAGSYLIGLGLALLLDQQFPARGIFRVALLIPWIIPSVVSIVSWRWIIGDQQGVVNLVLHQFGAGPILFLSTANWATFSVIVIKIWRSFPFMMITCLAALQAIDHGLYEAANIDGAGRWAAFRYITFPHIKTVSIVAWVLMAIWCFNDFETIWLLTGGGPSNATENLLVLAYKYTFVRNKVGVGSAIAVVSLVILMTLAVFMLRRQKEAE